MSEIRREARQLYHLCLVKGVLDENRVRQVVQRYVQSKPRGWWAFLAQFQRLVRLDRAAHTAQVESALSLPPDLKTRVQDGVTSTYGSGISISFAENPALIGGMRIKVGSDVYDGTIRAELDALEKSF